MGWNGKDFTDELAAKLGDETTSFKSKVTLWLNDGVLDIASRHPWSFTRRLGKKVLTSAQAEQDLTLGQPSAPSVAISAGGSLVEDSVYKVLVTFYESSSKNESVAGVASASVTATAVNKTISLTAVPVSSDPLVTARRIYLSIDGGVYYYYGEIANNTATTTTVTSETVTTQVAPDEHSIRSLDGNPFISDQRSLVYKGLDDIISTTWATNSSGDPQYWSDIQEEKIHLYPKPSSALTLNFYYYKIPNKTIYSLSSPIDIPEWLKPDLESYVVWRGYEYRDRDGQESKRSNYEQLIERTISKKGAQKKVARRVRDVVGNTDGWVL